MAEFWIVFGPAVVIGLASGWLLRGAWDVEKRESFRWETSINEWESAGHTLSDYEAGCRAEARRHHPSNREWGA